MSCLAGAVEEALRPSQYKHTALQTARLQQGSDFGKSGDTCDGVLGGRAGGTAYIVAAVHLTLLGSIVANGEEGRSSKLDNVSNRVVCGGSGAGETCM